MERNEAKLKLTSAALTGTFHRQLPYPGLSHTVTSLYGINSCASTVLDKQFHVTSIYRDCQLSDFGRAIVFPYRPYINITHNTELI